MLRRILAHFHKKKDEIKKEEHHPEATHRHWSHQKHLHKPVHHVSAEHHLANIIGGMGGGGLKF